MEEKQIHLANGDLLIRTEEGVYFTQIEGTSLPLLIDQKEGENLLFETAVQLRNIVNNLMQDEVKVKFIREIDVVLQDEEIDEDERNTSFTVYECMKCHWKFVGDCERHGYGFTSEGVQAPDYCPMCGAKISDTLED
ncbi:hypothetical protein [Peribacillus frigoritolerans]|uniref:hypothetical protein n=1 Tax=Peribacillus frigoritolerans TaxID=450367 RepID=UPI002EA91326|nr:hypothetical protein [Peribacillus frigoritolerans]